ncbi:hypothetical protein M670_00477 [Schinkia azotoformans MEV2011]|uniref:Uncharacterized protein n=1 Tax=Schinkia azotoformans MEV2011 TaxID=1348973 RepID=A0A072NSJ5_SCHAZ|nr:hypothetical protein [Schinkia azotoformans]KEF40451.1 hypothetical protein M670_00477 [Schinkia azotoformans MEV2011]MEC1696139.1 hypothetical protein [Schinkia azotoformans]MEC1716646.1 hypothetical protein [Schinkia azotoformans]MEC1725358.1 hypothetical protein [Schinkia azotoformans]MEC1739485.1 hypothetical protein [Schinkia azotoformans]
MQVAVIKSDLKSRWYANRIGEIFEVVGEEHDCFKVKASGYRNTKLIRKENVKVVGDLSYTFGRKSWKNPDSKYAYAPDDQFDKDVKANFERYENRKAELKSLLVSEINKDPHRQKETLSIIIDVHREIKEEKAL